MGAAVTDQTSLNPDDVRNTANKIGQIMDDGVMKIFNDLGTNSPSAGQFPTAKWLADRVVDRITGLAQQGQILKTAFGDICTTLNAVADLLQNTDQSNADKIKQDINDLKTNIAADLSSLGQPPKTKN
jgi:cell division protein ZapA (FtsZ GTPase activity inhibitor)